MNVLISGIGGLLGSRLAQWILETQPGVTVHGIDDFSCGYPENVPAGAHCYRHTLGGPHERCLSLFRTLRPTLVFHFAAYAAEGLSPFIRRYNYRNNLVATAELLSAAIEYPVERFVFTSSMAVYGRQLPPFSEDMLPAPIDPYGVAKAAAEADVRIAGDQHALSWTIIRPHNVYGVHQDLWTPYRNVLGIWMARHLRGLPLRIYGDGHQQRAFSWVDDCLPCLWRAATERQTLRQIINLGGTRPVSIYEAAQTLVDVMAGGTIEFHEPRHEVARAWCTWQKSIDLLGYADQTSLRDGLATMWAWAQRVYSRAPVRPPMDYEISRGLYSYWRTPT